MKFFNFYQIFVQLNLLIELYQLRDLIAASDGEKLKILIKKSPEKYSIESKFHNIKIKSLELLSDDNLAGGLQNGTILIWFTSNWTISQQIDNHTGSVQALSYVNDTTFASGCEKGLINIWTKHNSKYSLAKNLVLKNSILNLKYIPKINFLVVVQTSNNVSFYNLKSFHFNQNHFIACTSAIEVIDSSFIAYSSSEYVEIYNPLNSSNFISLPTEYKATSLKLMENGKLACGLYNGHTYIWNLAQLKNIDLDCHKTDVNVLEEVENVLFTGSSSIKLWNLETLENINSFSGKGQLNSMISLQKKFTEDFSQKKTTVDLSTVRRFNETEIRTIKDSTSPHLIDLSAHLTSPIISSNFTYSNENFQASEFTTNFAKFSGNQKQTTKLSKFFIVNSEFVLNVINTTNDIVDCLANCSNRGFCYLQRKLKYTCSCSTDYGGSQCQFNLKPCFSNPCLNNGTCVDFRKSQNESKHYAYKCECDQFYHGPNCQFEIDLCKNESCSKNGYCYRDQKLTKCKCFFSFSGDRCQIESNEIKVQKIVKTTSKVIAIIVLASFFILCIICDILRCFEAKRNGSRKNVVKKNEIKRFEYKS